MSSYLDSSFLVSLYFPDSNYPLATTRFREIQTPALISPLGELEFTNTLQIYVFRKQIASSDARRVDRSMRDDVRAGLIAISPIGDEVFALARRLANRLTARLGIRTLDILHVAAALEIGTDEFETFDQRQKALAEAVGFKVR